MPCTLDELFWKQLLKRIKLGEVIPVLGPGVVTFGENDQLLIPWLAEKVAKEQDLEFPADAPPTTLQQVVDAQRKAGEPVDRIHYSVHQIVQDRDLRPGITLQRLAAIEPFKLFLTTAFDPLLARAVASDRPGGRDDQRVGAISTKDPAPDLPQPYRELEFPFVFHLLGRARPVVDFVVWDDDALHMLLALDHALSSLIRFNDAIEKNHLLFLGLSLPDWLVRFFVQVVKRKRLSQLAPPELYLAETMAPEERQNVVIYFSRLSDHIQIIPTDPRAFIDELNQRWHLAHPKSPDPIEKTMNAFRFAHRSPGCVFVSYTSADEDVATYVVSQLQKAGVLVWFDKQQLRPGEDWEAKFSDAVRETCGIFLSLISDHTDTRRAAYNILERNLAARRRDQFADNAIFYIPLRIDEGEPLVPENEPRGTKKIQGVRKLGGHLDADFIAYLRELQTAYRTAIGLSSIEPPPVP